MLPVSPELARLRNEKPPYDPDEHTGRDFFDGNDEDGLFPNDPCLDDSWDDGYGNDEVSHLAVKGFCQRYLWPHSPVLFLILLYRDQSLKSIG